MINSQLLLVVMVGGSVYQRGWVINSQRALWWALLLASISKGMGDQFSAQAATLIRDQQYIKGDG